MSKLGCWSGGELVGASEQQTNSKSEIRNPIRLRQGSFDATSPSSLRFDATRGKPKSEIGGPFLALRSMPVLRSRLTAEGGRSLLSPVTSKPASRGRIKTSHSEGVIHIRLLVTRPRRTKCGHRGTEASDRRAACDIPSCDARRTVPPSRQRVGSLTVRPGFACRRPRRQQ